MISLFTFHNFFTHIFTIGIFLSTIVTNITSDFTDNAITYLNNGNIDRTQALLLVESSLQAYNVMDEEDTSICHLENVTAPLDYEVVDCWTGVDQVFNDFEQIESYGVVFRTHQSPYKYIFAFRGTHTLQDLLEDFSFNLTNFTPYSAKTPIPPQVQVESGFYGIYTDIDPDRTINSMQQQLFALINKYQTSTKPIDQLYITGHSLGAAISQLFTLDLVLSMPQIKVSNYNYASPRVGNNDFVDFYEEQITRNTSHTPTIRIQNVRDQVPCMPLVEEGYQHLSYAYLVDFYKEDWLDLDFIVENHSILNYKKVLDYYLNSDKYRSLDDLNNVLGSHDIIKIHKPNPQLVCNLW